MRPGINAAVNAADYMFSDKTPELVFRHFRHLPHLDFLRFFRSSPRILLANLGPRLGVLALSRTSAHFGANIMMGSVDAMSSARQRRLPSAVRSSIGDGSPAWNHD